MSARIIGVGARISVRPSALAALDEIGLDDAVRGAGGRSTAGEASSRIRR